jgi:hypothetical protein
MSSSNLALGRGPRSSFERSVLLTGALVAAAICAPARAAIDLAALEVSARKGQTADQTRRDRYECHNWAVEQTGVVPLAAPAPDEADEDERARRAERMSRVLSGAAIGAGLGGLVRSVQRKNTSNGALAGAAVGAVVGAATGRSQEQTAEDEEASNYLRALSACLEGRGYSVSLPGAEDSAAEVVAAK